MAPVPITDVWAEFARLAALGWTQQRIADAKGCSVPKVSLRLKWHATLPDRARKAVLDGLLDEGHLTAVSGVSLDVQSLHDWLTTEQAQTELVDEVLGKHRGSKAGVIIAERRSAQELAKDPEHKAAAQPGEHGKGRPKDRGDNVTSDDRGNSADYTIARLKRDRPDLVERVASGELENPGRRPPGFPKGVPPPIHFSRLRAGDGPKIKAGAGLDLPGRVCPW